MDLVIYGFWGVRASRSYIITLLYNNAMQHDNTVMILLVMVYEVAECARVSRVL